MEKDNPHEPTLPPHSFPGHMNSQPSLFACLGIVVICIAIALESAVKLSSERYVAGKADCYEVLEAQQQLFPAQPNLARTQRDELLALVALYKSLGGGWQEACAEISQITKPLNH